MGLTSLKFVETSCLPTIQVLKIIWFAPMRYSFIEQTSYSTLYLYFTILFLPSNSNNSVSKINPLQYNRCCGPRRGRIAFLPALVAPEPIPEPAADDHHKITYDRQPHLVYQSIAIKKRKRKIFFAIFYFAMFLGFHGSNALFVRIYEY
jgi:hypothetical protein